MAPLDLEQLGHVLAVAAIVGTDARRNEESPAVVLVHADLADPLVMDPALLGASS